MLVIGAGGLGAPLLQYLAAAGVGTIGIVDDDVVSLSNLQRQVIHRHARMSAGRRSRAPRRRSARLNPHVAVNVHPTRLTAENARGLVAGYDVVADGSDNFDTRYAVSDACFYERKPLVTAALGQFDGSLTTIRAHETRAGRHGRTRPIAASSPPRRRRARSRPAPRPACSARSPA